MKLPPALAKLSKIKHAKLVGIMLTLLITVCLLVTPFFIPGMMRLFSIVLVVIAVLSFLILYIFGIREGKHLAIYGIVIMIIAGAIWGPLALHWTFTKPAPDSADSQYYMNWASGDSFDETEDSNFNGPNNYTRGRYWYILEDGNLTPYKSGTGSFHFSITLYSNDTFASGLPVISVAVLREVYLDVSTYYMTEVSNDTIYEYGKEFFVDVVIDNEMLYSHWFALEFQSGGSSVSSLNTTVVLGPLVGSEGSLLGWYALFGMNSMCMPILFFVIVVLLYWWLGTAKKKREGWLKPEDDDEATDDDEEDDDFDEVEPAEEKTTSEEKMPPEDDGDFTCTSCGGSVSESHNFCPGCGERFDGIEDEGPKEPSEAEAEAEIEEEANGEPDKDE